MNRVIASVVLAGLVLVGGMASAQDYPTKSIKIVVAFAAGGGNDLLARIVGQELSHALKQPVIIENRPGAGTQIGASEVARAAPDGYTLLVSSATTFSLNPTLYKKLPYDPIKDFALVSLLGRFDLILVTTPSFPARTLPELVALAKEKPNTIQFASAGVASPHQLAMELLAFQTGTKMVHVPYKGAGPAVQDVIGGHVPTMMLDVATARQPINAGLLKAIAASAPVAEFPDLPTFEQLGQKGFEPPTWIGIAAPAGTPQLIVDRLNREIVAILRTEATRRKIVDVGGTVLAGTPQQFADFMRIEAAKWKELLEAANISVQ
jgi:tripartite-type tricarboxylate transporter receptor subunit TctC